MPRTKHAKRQARKRRDLLSILLIVVGLLLLATAGGMWLKAQLRYRQQAKVNEALAAYVTVHDEPDVQAKEGPLAPDVDWEGLKAINDEVVAWLQIPGTQINYPVYQGKDNDRYLRNTATGEWAVGGQIFVDYACTRPGMVDPLTLVYGHHLLDGSMFNSIADMDNQETFDAVDTVWYVTQEQAWECEPLLLYATRSDDQEVRTFTFESEDAFHAYLAERVEHALVKREDAARIAAGARHVLCLITCNYYDEFDGYGRTILVCVPKDEAKAQVQ